MKDPFLSNIVHKCACSCGTIYPRIEHLNTSVCLRDQGIFAQTDGCSSCSVCGSQMMEVEMLDLEVMVTVER